MSTTRADTSGEKNRWQLEEDGKVIGIFDTREEAFAAGTGNPVIIRKVK